MKKVYMFLSAMLTVVAMNAQPCNFSYSQLQPNQIEFYAPAAYINSLYDCNWDFGDGSSIFADTTLHTFITQGNQIINLTVFENATGNIVCTSTQTLSLTFCDWHFDQDTSSKSTFTFYAGNLQGNTAEWNFGDGNIATGDTVTHTYTNPGTYIVALTQKDPFLTIVCVTSFYVAYNPTSLCGFDVSIPNSVINPMYFALNALVPSSNGTVSWDYDVPGAPAGSGYYTSVAYGDTGTYNICMTYTGNDGYSCQSCLPVVALHNCDFAAFQDSANPNLYFFDAYNTTPGTQYNWDFNDGTIYTGGDTVSHFFSQPGFYMVSMNIIDTSNNTVVCSYTMPIMINGNPFNCQADFTTVSIGLDAYFIDQSTTIVPNQVNYQWSFGDGLLSSQRFPQHHYAGPGTYNVCLSVNSFGCISTFCDLVVIDTTIVNPTTCNASFIFTQTANFQIVGVNLSSGNNLSFSWDFGDGGTATGPFPSHQYVSTGTYPVCLTVSDTQGCVDTYCDTLTVDANGNIVYRGTSVGFVLNIMSPLAITGIKNIEKDSDLKLYPIPAHDYVYADMAASGSTEVPYEIVSIEGNKILQGMLTAGMNKLSVRDLAKGIYLLRLLNTGGTSTHKTFIKE